MRKNILLATVMAIPGIATNAPAHAVVFLGSSPGSVDVSVFPIIPKEVAVTVTTGETLTITSVKNLPISDFLFADFMSGSIPTTFTYGSLSSPYSVTFTGPGTWDYFVEINPLDLRHTGLSTKLEFALLAPVSVDPPAPAVPEPSTWAMMIMGFLGIGFMAYRRKTPATAPSFGLGQTEIGSEKPPSGGVCARPVNAGSAQKAIISRFHQLNAGCVKNASELRLTYY